LLVLRERTMMNVNPEAAVDKPAGGLALGPAILASDLLLVAPERLVEPGSATRFFFVVGSSYVARRSWSW